MAFGNDNLPTGKEDHFLEPLGFSDNPLSNLIHQMDSFFNQFFNQMNAQLPINPFQVDTHETETDVIVAVKLPGCKREQIQLEIVDNNLKISVEDSLLEEIKHPAYTGRKQFYQRRVHFVPLPFLIEEKEAKVSFDHELLTVSFPKENRK